jgi:Domain of unknown function (DUF1841)
MRTGVWPLGRCLALLARPWDNCEMSPRSRGRPPARRRQQPGRSAARGGVPRLAAAPSGEIIRRGDDRCWFEEPEPGDRSAWALPSARGTYQGLDLELLDPGDEDERALLIEALHPEFTGALNGDDDMPVDGEPVNPALHMAMHQVVANQLLADDPPETWQAVQRLAGLGYDWHNIMHMIASLIAEDVYSVLREHRQPDPAAYARRLSGLPGDWPSPQPDR